MPGTFGGLGKLEFSPTTAPDDPNPVYVDITPYVRTETVPLAIVRGRQSELDQIQSSQLTCVLDNTDNRFTYGYTSGPYGTNWVSGKRFRYSETIGGQQVVLFTGYLEFPDIDAWQPIGYQEVQLTLLDRLTRLGRARTFVSTLAEQIRFAGGTGLQYYWPLNDAVATSFANTIGAANPLLPVFTGVGGTPIALATPTGAYITPNAAPALFADELLGPRWYTDLNLASAGQSLRWMQLVTNLATPLVTANPTIVCWVYPDLTRSNGANFAPITLSSTDGLIQFAFDGVNWVGFFSAGASNVSFTMTPLRSNAWNLVTVQMALPSGVCTTIVNAAAPVTGTLSGAPPASETYIQLIVGFSFEGSVDHAQFYSGATAWSAAAHTAQYTGATVALDQQLTGSRINTLLDYAGVSSTERLIDPGIAVMQRATLAGQSPGTALVGAVGTERGRGFIDGLGRYVFQDRIRYYNV